MSRKFETLDRSEINLNDVEAFGKAVRAVRDDVKYSFVNWPWKQTLIKYLLRINKYYRQNLISGSQKSEWLLNEITNCYFILIASLTNNLSSLSHTFNIRSAQIIYC